MLFYTMPVVNSGFRTPIRYLIANASAGGYALMVGLEHAGWLGAAAGAFPASVVPAPPWSAQVAMVATFVLSLNLLAAITERLMRRCSSYSATGLPKPT